MEDAFGRFGSYRRMQQDLNLDMGSQSGAEKGGNTF